MKEMENVRLTFECFEGTESKLPPGYQMIDCHMIFDVKIGDSKGRQNGDRGAQASHSSCSHLLFCFVQRQHLNCLNHCCFEQFKYGLVTFRMLISWQLVERK